MCTQNSKSVYRIRELVMKKIRKPNYRKLNSHRLNNEI